MRAVIPPQVDERAIVERRALQPFATIPGIVTPQGLKADGRWRPEGSV
jgi:hypothetical protein